MSDLNLIQRLNDYIAHEKHPHFLKEAQNLAQNPDPQELAGRFKGDLEFGTGGMRGIMGAGSAYMNPYNVAKATQGLCNYIKTIKKDHLKAVLSYDSRHFSYEFAQEAALVFAGNGFETVIFKEARPTPFLSFTLRHLGADTGIMLTASHNPPEYNGYKAYWNNGGQVTPPHDTAIVDAFTKVEEIHSLSLEEAKAKGLLKFLGEELDVLYMENLNRALPQFKELVKTQEIHVVYTPLHGVGGLLIDKLFPESQVHVHKVAEQIQENGDFPTVEFPNPEEPSAYKLGLELANKVGADIVIANDPDADRMGAQVKDAMGNWVFINGNQIGCLFIDYLLRHDSHPEHGYLMNSLVTTDLQEKIASHYGARTFKTLTGFKWMAKEIDALLESQPQLHMVLATEESYGYLRGENIRDKDALVATKLMVEIMLWVKSQGMSLLDYLSSIWEKVEFYEDALLSKTFKGLDGNTQRERIMTRLREENVQEIGGFSLLYKRDYLTLKHYGNSGTIESIDPKFKSDTIEILLKDNAKFSLRPSGTEPKVKMYLSTWGKFEEKEEILKRMEMLKKALEGFLE